MKKFLGILILLLVLIGGIWVYWHFFWVFGEGVKAGQLNNFMKKGYMFKTYEGKLIQAGFKGAGTPGVQSNEFTFSVTNEKVAAQLMTNSGKQFELRYKEYSAAVPWRGVSEYVVDSVLSMKDANGVNIPFAQ